ncbi:MAG: Na+/H+ antiporter [Gemmatimonadaceae bacterium]|nr:Na+/H+ antiporter [Gemmatimonadaceae bacterium]
MSLSLLLLSEAAPFQPVFAGVALATLVVALTALARKLPVPSPILQVLAGLVLGFIPGLRVPELEPDLVFFFFLPPILWAAAFFTSVREFRQNLRPIGLLAVGLVFATSAVVAVTAHALLPGVPWAVAVAIGAIVSPPDAVAAAAIVSRLPVPRRVVVILEGESLVNDAAALVLYRTAVAAAVTGVFSLGEAVVRFFIDAGVGVLVGILVGWLAIRIIRVTHDALAETLLTIAAPYFCWVVAESLHVSAVLACVAGGVHVRQHFSTVVSPMSRLQSRAVWDLLVFVINALIFLILGLQFHALLETVTASTLVSTLGTGAVISVVAILVRLVWVPVATILPRRLSRRLRRDDPLPDRRAVALVAWTGMRGIVSLAAALALPLTLAGGTPFPFRAEIILITMCVIMITLVLQGLTLTPIIRAFAFVPETHHREEERHARREALRRGAEALEDLSREPWAAPEEVAQLRHELRDRIQLHERHAGDVTTQRRLRRGILAAERRMLVRLRNEGAISDETLRELEEELDHESVRVGVGLTS